MKTIRTEHTIVSTPQYYPTDKSSGMAEKRVIFHAYQIIWYVLGIFETLLMFRFMFKLSAASPRSPFVQMIYGITQPLVVPFRGIYTTTAVEGSAFEWVTLVAMLVYVILAYGVVQLFQLIKPADEEEVEQLVDNQ